MWLTKFADDGVFQLFDYLEIVGMDIFIEKVPKKKKCKELITGENGTHSAGFST